MPRLDCPGYVLIAASVNITRRCLRFVPSASSSHLLNMASSTNLDPVEQKLSAARELMEETCNSKLPGDLMYQPQWEIVGAHVMFFKCLLHIYRVRLSLCLGRRPRSEPYTRMKRFGAR